MLLKSLITQNSDSWPRLMLEIRSYIDNNVDSKTIQQAVFSDTSITADILARLFDSHTVPTLIKI
jgi:HD-like signal output (HDOD) protein